MAFTAGFLPVPQTFTPAYLHYQGLEKCNRTTYGNMNEWMKVPGRTIPDNAPVTLSDGTWQRIPMNPQGHNVYDSTPDERFNRAYGEMTQRIAYRHPNPGPPRSRQGRIGGSWRHIKEVLGHGGSQICFVDGLVRAYDGSNLNSEMSDTALSRPHLPPQSPRCTYNKYDISDHQGRVQAHRSYEYERCLPPVSQGSPRKSDNYQGFYRLR